MFPPKSGIADAYDNMTDQKRDRFVKTPENSLTGTHLAIPMLLLSVSCCFVAMDFGQRILSCNYLLPPIMFGSIRHFNGKLFRATRENRMTEPTSSVD